MSNTVILKGFYGVRKEAKAATAITPGDFLSYGPSGVSRAAAAGVEKLVAVENEVVGWDLNHDYAINENVLYEAVHSGQEVNALVAAGAAAIAAGDAVKISANGKVAKATLPTDIAGVVGYSMVALDNSGGGSPARLRVEIA
jgi:hypothetical protein